MEHWTNLITEWLAAYGLKVVGALAIIIFGRIVVGLGASEESADR